jgi:hypothetical protein
MSDLESPHFSIGWAAMAKYTMYLFNLQHNNDRTVIEQRMHLNAYKDQERLRPENAILHHGTLQSMDKDLEL